MPPDMCAAAGAAAGAAATAAAGAAAGAVGGAAAAYRALTLTPCPGQATGQPAR